IAATESGARIFTGCSTGKPRASASVLIRGGVSSSFLPAGLSGCVTSATTSCSSSSQRKLGSAISPVPMKTILMVRSFESPVPSIRSIEAQLLVLDDCRDDFLHHADRWVRGVDAPDDF